MICPSKGRVNFLFIFFLNSTNIVEVFRTISRPPQIFLAEIWTIYDKIYNQIIDLFHQNCDFVENFFQNSYYSVYTKIKACNLNFQIKPNLWLDPFSLLRYARFSNKSLILLMFMVFHTIDLKFA